MNLESLLGGKTASTKKSTGIVVTDPELIAAAERFIAADEALERAEGAIESEKMTFRPAVRRAWFAANAGRQSPEGLRIITTKGKVSVSFASQWFPTGDVVGSLPEEMRRKKCELKIDVQKISEEKQVEVVQDLLAVLNRHGASEAMIAKLVDYPREEFASSRHRILTPEANEALELSGLNTRISFRR